MNIAFESEPRPGIDGFKCLNSLPQTYDNCKCFFKNHGFSPCGVGFFTYFHHSPMINHLTDEQVGRVFKALLKYGDEDVEPDFDDDHTCALAFIILKGEVDYNFERYAETCESRSKAAKEREAKKRERAHDEESRQ